MTPLHFWLEFGSTYSYLSVARIGALAARHGVSVVWQPFYLMPLFIEQGMHQGPFLPYPNKINYMWRDLERRAARHGIAYRKPSTYPPNSLPAARVALVAAHEGWCQAFAEKAFALHWTEDRAIGSDDNLDTALRSLGKDPAAVRAQAQSPQNKDALKAQTDRARALRIFGSPSFVVDDELFWGDDRLDDAVEWAAAR
jgi:2-hydroxychromene-2-carboxylate isomerase